MKNHMIIFQYFQYDNKNNGNFLLKIFVYLMLQKLYKKQEIFYDRLKDFPISKVQL